MLRPLTVWLGSLLFAGIGAWALAAPHAVAAAVGIELTTGVAVADFRAVYGGLSLGIAALLAWCAADTSRVAMGLAAMGASFAGLAFGRAVGLVAAGEGSPLMVSFLAAELLGAAVPAALLARRPESAAS